MRRGFTLIELMIVIVIMGILLVVGVVEVTGSQVKARDNERTGDTSSIAAALETYYTSATAIAGASSNYSYPSTALIGTESTLLPDLNTEALTSPSDPNNGDDFVAATNNAQTVAGITPRPSSDNDVYVYQPLQSDGTLCTSSSQECRKFTIYYYLESDGSIHTITSRHQ